MTALIVTVFLASVIGSLHCAGMCGAFLAFAVGSSGNVRSQVLLQAMYHGGRLLTYTTLGVIAGTVGHLVDLSSTLAGIAPVAAILAGATMMAFGVVTLLRIWGVSIARLQPPAFLMSFVQRAHGHAMRRTPLARALMIGLATTLLPCGWLYAFAVTAAGTASPVRGGFVMAAFWLGTLPILISLGAGLRGLLGGLGKKVPTLTCIALVAVGVYTVTGRLWLDPIAMARSLETHDAPAVPVSTEKLPCCESK